jgi:hypothetical protein
MAKTYGQRPSSLLPKDMFLYEEQALAFDLNVMLLGMANEVMAHDAPTKGFTSTRREAYALAQRANRLAEIEFKESS